MNKIPLYTLKNFGICMLLLLTGCVSRMTTNPLPATSQLVVTANKLEPTLVLLTPTPTLTLTPHPTPTATRTSTPTWTTVPTRLPTLASPMAQALVTKLLETNNGCQLPCWWGIEPGKTKWQTAHAYLESFANEISAIYRSDLLRRGAQSAPEILYTASFNAPKALFFNGIHRQAYSVEGGVITMIAPDVGKLPQYNLSEVLKTYGPPGEVWIRTFSIDREFHLPFYLLFFYRDQGIMFLYHEDAIREAENVHVCFNKRVYYPQVWLWQPGINIEFKEVANLAAGFGIDEPKYYLSIEEPTNQGMASFVKEFLDNNGTRCIDTPADHWPFPE